MKCPTKKPATMIEIKEIPFQICEHNPKAQSVCSPDETVTFNEFFQNLQTQIKKIYDSTKCNPTEEKLSVREKNANNLRNRRH
jgi:hypothetical protein